MEETPSVVGASNDSNNKKTRFILVKGDTKGIVYISEAEGTLYRVSKAAAKDILQGLREHGFDAVVLKEAKGKSAAA